MIKVILYFCLFSVFLLGPILPASGVQNIGKEKITLTGGKLGDVAFPHRRHQDRRADCNTCHALFPQTPGAIEAKKTEGTLYKKQVMKVLCITCHIEKRNAGEPSGPTSCNTCHIK